MVFRPINSDDHTRFVPPSDHVKKTDASHKGQKRDFSYEVEQIEEEKREHPKHHEETFGEDTFEASSEQEENMSGKNEEEDRDRRTPPESGHVDVQI
ncbi:MAG: hypothetical protein KDB65_03890 [Calditrichaeota bacterium]|nr:hypothetical protein [Calditrichota bacterium]